MFTPGGGACTDSPLPRRDTKVVWRDVSRQEDTKNEDVRVTAKDGGGDVFGSTSRHVNAGAASGRPAPVPAAVSNPK